MKWTLKEERDAEAKDDLAPWPGVVSLTDLGKWGPEFQSWYLGNTKNHFGHARFRGLCHVQVEICRWWDMVLQLSQQIWAGDRVLRVSHR